MHRFEPRFHHMKATGLLFHMVKARVELVHFSVFYGNVSTRSHGRQVGSSRAFTVWKRYVFPFIWWKRGSNRCILVHFMTMFRLDHFLIHICQKNAKKMQKQEVIFLIFSNFFMIFSDRNMAIKCVKMHRFEPRFHHMKATGLLFYLVKTRLETDNFSSI